MRKSGYCPVFSVSEKKLKKLKIKHCTLQRVCQFVGREQKRGCRKQRERERYVSLPRTERGTTAKELERAVGMKATLRKKIRRNCLFSLWEVG